MRVELAQPTVALRDSYLGGMRELQEEGRRADLDLEALALAFEDHVALLLAWSEGRLLRDGWVPWTEYWIVTEGVWAGRIAHRHYLTPALERLGGHIGYEVRPTRRGRGVATRALGLLVERLRASGPARLLVTCDTNNMASRRVIEKNGGVLADVVALEGRAVPTMRWWITTRDEP